MALRYIDSMGDHYTAAQTNLKWTASFGPIRDTGLHGYGMRGSFTKGMLFGSTTLIMEAQIKWLSGGAYFFSLFDTGTDAQIFLKLQSDGSILATRWGSNPAADLIAQTAPDLVRSGTWYHLGWKVLLHPSAGSVEVRLNGVAVITISGVRTVATGALPWSGAVGSFAIGDNGGGVVFDDLVVMDDVDDAIDDTRLPGGGGF